MPAGLIGGPVRATGFGERRDITPVIPEVEQTPEQEAQAALEAEADTILADDVAAQAPAEAEPAVTPTTELTPAQEAVVAEEGPQAEAIVKAAKAKVAEYSPEPTVKTAPVTTSEPAVDAQARLALAANPKLATYSDDFIRNELKNQYSPELLEAIIAERKFMPAATVEATPAAAAEQAQAEFRAEYELKTPNTITNELLDDIGVFSKAPLRSKIVGKKLSDPEVQTSLRKYAKNSIIRKRAPELEARINELLGDSDATGLGTGVTTGDAGVGDGVTSGTERVAELGRRVRASGSADTAATPDEGPVGGSVLPSELPAVADGADADTLAAEPEVTTPEEVAPEAVADLTEQVDAVVAKPVTPAPATPAMQQAAIPGQVTGVAQQNIPAPVPPAPRVAPAQGSPVPQAQLQEAEAQRDAAAQAELNRIYESDPEPEVVRGVSKEKAVELAEAEAARRAEVREYQDAQVDPRDVAEVTTAVDKEGVVELLNTKDGDLDAQGKAAKLYFSRFRRPVDALAEIGATAVVGPTQTVKKDYVQVQTKEGRVPQFSFYKGMTQKSAMDARRWVHANMSDSAIQEMIRARRVANRDTVKFSPSDAYIGVVKAAKSIQKDIDRYAKKQQSKDVKALAEMERLRAANDSLNKRMNERFADSPLPPEAQMVRLASGAEAVRVTRPVKGKTAFESYLIGTGLQIRENDKISTVGPTTKIVYDPETKSVVPTEEILDLYDGMFRLGMSSFSLILCMVWTWRSCLVSVTRYNAVICSSP